MKSSIINGPKQYSGPAKLCHFRRLGQCWRDLATYFNIPHYVVQKFERGTEPEAIWNWMEQKGRLDEWEEGLRGIDMGEIIDQCQNGSQNEESLGTKEPIIIPPSYAETERPNVFLFTGARGAAGKTTMCLGHIGVFEKRKKPGACLEFNFVNQDLWTQLFLGMGEGHEKLLHGIHEEWKYSRILDSNLITLVRQNSSDLPGRIGEVYRIIDDVIDKIRAEFYDQRHWRNIWLDTNFNLYSLVDSGMTIDLCNKSDFKQLCNANFMIFYVLSPENAVAGSLGEFDKKIYDYCRWMEATRNDFLSTENIVWVINPLAYYKAQELARDKSGPLHQLRKAESTRGISYSGLFVNILKPISNRLVGKSMVDKYNILAEQILRKYNGKRPSNIFVFAHFDEELNGLTCQSPFGLNAVENRDIFFSKTDKLINDVEEQWDALIKYINFERREPWTFT